MSAVQQITLDSLRAFPLPRLADAGDKEDRGRVLVVGGGERVPGAGLLTGLAALRVGAGKLQLAAPQAQALGLGLAVPEAGVIALPTGPGGEPADEAVEILTPFARRTDALVVGPGLMDESSAGGLAAALISASPKTTFVVDAAAMTGLGARRDPPREAAGRLILTPHAGEMARLCGRPKDDVLADPLAFARDLAAAHAAVVIAKGAETFVVSPDGRAWRYAGGGIGLATSGSGDVLAGAIAGVVARGASPLTASLWGVCLHGEAGARLAASIGAVGFLARELLPELPRVLAAAGGDA